MNESYADVLESYMIAEEGFFSRLKEKREKKRKEEENRKAKEDKFYNFSINKDKALQDSRLNLTPYPDNKWADNDDVIDSIEKELKMALPKVLNCAEVMNAINSLCEKYNNTPKEELDDVFCWIESYPSKLSPNWFKSKFKVYYDCDFFEICDCDQNFRAFYAIEIIEVLAAYIKKKYANYKLHVDTGDGDEGCIYVEF